VTRPIVLLGVPTALGGHLAGMERTPADLRRMGFVERLNENVRDAGDVRIEPQFRPDRSRRAKNRRQIAAFLPRQRNFIAEALPAAGQDPRLLVLGGDCTAHAGAVAGLRQIAPQRRLAIAWFDAHGDFNTPDTTPSGNVWGMPLAMICGLGDPDLVGACDGPSVDPRDAALLGGQVLDEGESRALVQAGVAHFGSGMLATDAGIDALAGWAGRKAREVDGLYVAVDFDVLDGGEGWAVQFPEPDGITLETAARAVDTLATTIPVVGFGATGVNLANGDARRTLDAIVRLARVALG
jgi:arginase